MADGNTQDSSSESSGSNVSGVGKYGYGGANKDNKIRVDSAEKKLKNGVTVSVNPHNLDIDRTVASNAAQNRPGGGRGGIASSFDQFFGSFIAEQERNRVMSFSNFLEEIELGHTEEFFEMQDEHEYEDWGEEEEEATIYPVIHEAKGPCWSGYDMIGMKKKGEKKVPNCVPVKEDAEKDGRRVSLGKPFLTPGENKKRAVYVKNDKGHVVKVRFGDPNMRIKKSSPSHRKSFRARHGCDVDAGPRWKAKYWSCKQW